jgi:hypothetical protein
MGSLASLSIFTTCVLGSKGMGKQSERELFSLSVEIHGALFVSQYIHYIKAKDGPIFYHFMQ